MAKQSQNKTLPTKASVKDFLAGIKDERQRKDAQQISRLMSKITGKTPVMWVQVLSASIVIITNTKAAAKATWVQ